ncbi:MAG: arginine/agmatine antiporter [Hyphococcus sp.]|nr:MAG: arginine/agmatine antiporter [Marinicaulis sp.]
MTGQQKQIGLFLAICIVTGNMIGSGIYLLPAALSSVGSSSLLAWGLAAVGAVILAIVYARLAVTRPANEGLIEYAKAACHPAIGFLNWAAYWLACWMGNVAVLLAAIGYFKAIFSLELSRGGDTGLLILSIWLVAGANLIGPRFIGRFSAATLALGLAPIVAAIVIGVLYFDPAMFAASWNVSGEPLTSAVSPLVLTIFWAFLGLESANAVSKVIDNPNRNVPRAAVIGVIIAALVYASASTALFGLLPADELKNSSAPFADAIKVAIGPVAGVMIAIAAFARTIGCAASWLLVTTEVNQAASKTGYLPKFLSAKNETGPRVRDILVVASLMTIVSLMTISSTLNAQFILIVDISVLMFLFVYGVSCFALIRFSLTDRGNPHGASDRIIGLMGLAATIAIIFGYFAS